MGYHTHFYAYDKSKQVDWAKEILGKYKEQLQKELDSIPEDNFFKRMYDHTKEMVSNDEYEIFRENAEKYNWPKEIVEKNEAFFAKYRRYDYTWESEKKEWVDKLNNLKDTGLLHVFEDVHGSELVDYLIDNWKLFKERLNAYDLHLDYQLREGKIYSGHILQRHYRVKGRYCQSMWFNPDGIIEMIEDYVDVNKKNEDGSNPMVKLSNAEKNDIESLFRDYPDSYCWVI